MMAKTGADLLAHHITQLDANKGQAQESAIADAEIAIRSGNLTDTQIKTLQAKIKAVRPGSPHRMAPED